MAEHGVERSSQPAGRLLRLRMILFSFSCGLGWCVCVRYRPDLHPITPSVDVLHCAHPRGDGCVRPTRHTAINLVPGAHRSRPLITSRCVRTLEKLTVSLRELRNMTFIPPCPNLGYTYARRTLHNSREGRLKNMMGMGQRRRSHTAAAAEAAAAEVAAAAAAAVSRVPSSTSPDGLSAVSDIASAMHPRFETPGSKHGEAATTAGHHTDKCESCAVSPKGGRRTCRYRLRRGGGAKARGNGEGGPPEMNLKQHGRGGGKDKGWRSMHMVQCLRYHEVRVRGRRFVACLFRCWLLCDASSGIA